MGVAKKVVDLVKGKKEVKVVKAKQVEEVACSNCDNSGAQCSTCSPVFRDTFGE